MILVIDTNPKAARNLSDMLFYMGFLSHAITPKELASEYDARYRAILLTNPTSLYDTEDFVRKIRSISSTIPIFAISSGKCERSELFNRVYERGGYAARLAEDMVCYCDEMGLEIPGHYTAVGLDVSADLSVPTYFSQPMPFTKTEAMILRYLVRSYPTPVKAEEIRKYAYRPTKLPEVSNIRTHVSLINKKFRELTGKSLIRSQEGEGYLIALEARERQKVPALTL